MKRWLSILCLGAILLSACAAREAAEQPHGAPPAPGEENLPPPADTALPPEEERAYFTPRGGKRIAGEPISGEDLRHLAIQLGLKQWDSLNVVLEAFGCGRIEGGDLRICDITRFEEAPSGIVCSPYPIVKEGFEYAYLSLTGQETGAQFLVMFRIEETGGYRPASVIELDNYYRYVKGYENDLRVERIAGKTMLVWQGVIQTGTGYYGVEEQWYDCETGARVFAFTAELADYVTISHMEDLTQRAAYTYKEAEEGAACAEISREYLFMQETDEALYEESYADTYPVFYDARKDRFFILKESQRAQYQALSAHENGEIAQWARQRLQYLDAQQKPYEHPKEGARYQVAYQSRSFRYLSVYSRQMSREMLERMTDAINAQAYSGLRELLGAHGAPSYTLHEAPILLEDWGAVGDVRCTLDMRTAKEREAYVNILYDYEGQRRGLLLVYNIGTEAAWSLYHAIEYIDAEGKAPNISSFSQYERQLDVGVAEENGWITRETTAMWSAGGTPFAFIRSRRCDDGITYIASVRRPDHEAENLVGIYRVIGRKDDEILAQYELPVWKDAVWHSGPYYSEDPDFYLLLEGAFDEHSGLQERIREALEERAHEEE